MPRMPLNPKTQPLGQDVHTALQLISSKLAELESILLQVQGSSENNQRALRGFNGDLGVIGMVQQLAEIVRTESDTIKTIKEVLFYGKSEDEPSLIEQVREIRRWQRNIQRWQGVFGAAILVILAGWLINLFQTHIFP